jgi:hypothetical protein
LVSANKIRAAKTYGGAALFTLLFAAFIVYTSLGITKGGIVDTSSTYVSDSSVRESILGFSIEDLHEIQGVQISKADKISYYFEYEADHTQVLNVIASMPFRMDNNRSSTQCGLMSSESNPLLAYKEVSQTEFEASTFFWKAKPEEYIFYECVRSPMKHTMLVSKNSNRILHRVELI